jgi:hypothetical protein
VGVVTVGDETTEVSARVEALVREVLAQDAIVDSREVLEITLHVTTGKIWSTVSFTTPPRRPDG